MCVCESIIFEKMEGEYEGSNHIKRPLPQNQFSPYVVGCMWWWLIVLLIMTDGMLLLDGTLPAMNCGMLYLPCTIGVLYRLDG